MFWMCFSKYIDPTRTLLFQMEANSHPIFKAWNREIVLILKDHMANSVTNLEAISSCVRFMVI